MKLENRSFVWSSPSAQEFFREHGYVVVTGVLDTTELEKIAAGWDNIVNEACSQNELSPRVFVERFPQNRDLWRKETLFHDVLFQSQQGHVAKHFLQTSGARLFHDHAICKPAGRSGVIPWHQDSAYWPLDRVGLSLWTPLADVDANGGCLDVLDKSFLDGPAEPQDFLSENKVDFSDDPRLVRIPVKRGDTVVLHGLTWHSSAPNESAVDRLAYLTLWVPATARFVPEHAGWHPTAGHIHVSPGERLDGEWFPLFGTEPVDDEGEPVVFPMIAKKSRISMFTAGRDIAKQIAWLRNHEPAPLAALLSEGGIDQTIQAVCHRKLLPLDEIPLLRETLEILALQEQVRTQSVARDVYLRGAVRWWHLIGTKITEVQCEQ